MYELYIQAFLSVVSAVCGAVVSWIGYRIRKADLRREAAEAERERKAAEEATRLEKDLSLLKLGLLAMLHNRLMAIMVECLTAGGRKVYQTANVAQMFIAYDGLGGDGTIHEVYKEFCKLPIIGGNNGGNEND